MSNVKCQMSKIGPFELKISSGTSSTSFAYIVNGYRKKAYFRAFLDRSTTEA